MEDTPWRSIVKGITWRILASCTTMGIVFAMTGNLVLMASVGLTDVVLKLFVYYLHERAWGRVRWGHLGCEPCFAGKDTDRKNS